MINLAGGKGLDETQHCVGRKCTMGASSRGWCWCANPYFFYFPSLIREGRPCWHPPGCLCHPSHTNGAKSCPGERDRRSFVNARHLGWCSLSWCSLQGWRRGPWTHSDTCDNNSRSINCSQISPSHHVPLNHAFKSQGRKLGNHEEDTVS